LAPKQTGEELNVSPNLARLAPYDDDEALRVVVESPRGSTLKLEYEPSSRRVTERFIKSCEVRP
jgi:inorganic pyrophosphatase